MSYTLSNLIKDSYLILGDLQVGHATGGSDSTLLDSRLVGSGRDNDWQGGTLLVIEADGSAPEGEMVRVSASDDSSGELSLESALSASVGSGDLYGLASSAIPLSSMVELVNAALKELGDLPQVDSSTLSTVTGQTAFATALAWQRRPPVRVDVMGPQGSIVNPNWQRVYHWEYVPATAGQQAMLVFRRELPAGRALRIWYVDRHPRVEEFDEVICEAIAPALACAAVVERVIRWQYARLGAADSSKWQDWQQAKADLALAKASHPIWRPKRTAIMILSEVLP